MTGREFFRLRGPAESIATIATPQAFFTAAESKAVASSLYEPEVLEHPEYRGKTKVTDTTFRNVSFSKTRLRRLDFRTCLFEDCLFIGSQFDNCDFHDCRFIRCNMYKVTIANTYVDPCAFDKALDKKQHTNIGVHLFQQLYRNAADSHQPEFRDAAEFRFRNWERYQWMYQFRKKEMGVLPFLRKWLPQTVYFVVAEYGLKARFFAAWSLVFFIAVMSINHCFWDELKITSGGRIIHDNTWIQSVYFSLVTTTTLGYGDYVPSSQTGMIVVSVESVFGIIWLAVLAGMVIRRIVR